MGCDHAIFTAKNANIASKKKSIGENNRPVNDFIASAGDTDAISKDGVLKITYASGRPHVCNNVADWLLTTL